MKYLLGLIVIIVVIAAGGYFAFNSWYNNAINARGESTETVVFEIQEGENVETIMTNLEAAGLIPDVSAMQLYLRFNPGLAEGFQVGLFDLKPSQTIPEITESLQRARTAEEVRITIPEGLRYERIADILTEAFAQQEGEKQFTRAEFISIVENPDNANFSEDVTAFLAEYKPAGETLEGYLYPETYFFNIDDDALAVADRVLGTLVSELPDNMAELVSASDLSFYEALTLASIVEKEGISDDDRLHVASVFLNRLEIGMMLQSDATVNYATGKSERRPTFADLETDSPYNTYKYTGLPPTPITNPRVQAILAVLDPIETNYLYFIHEEDGTPHYGETLQDHNFNVCRYLDKTC